LSPSVFSTGVDSPVIEDWLIVACPFWMVPSTGIFPPGLTMTVSPSALTSISMSFLSTIAVWGEDSISFCIACVAFCWA